MDNLSTHTAAALYQTFPAAEARRILRRLEIYYTPKHASWLNMAEIEIGVMRRQCLDARIDSRARLEAKIEAWQCRRTKSGSSNLMDVLNRCCRLNMAMSYPTPLSTMSIINVTGHLIYAITSGRDRERL